MNGAAWIEGLTAAVFGGKNSSEKNTESGGSERSLSIIFAMSNHQLIFVESRSINYETSSPMSRGTCPAHDMARRTYGSRSGDSWQTSAAGGFHSNACSRYLFDKEVLQFFQISARL